jgi:hypothetical protein
VSPRDDDHNPGKEPCSVGKVKILRKTDRAILVQFEGVGGRELWIPQSAVHADSEVWKNVGDTGELIVEQWLAEREGLG